MNITERLLFSFEKIYLKKVLFVLLFRTPGIPITKSLIKKSHFIKQRFKIYEISSSHIQILVKNMFATKRIPRLIRRTLSQILLILFNMVLLFGYATDRYIAVVSRERLFLITCAERKNNNFLERMRVFASRPM